MQAQAAINQYWHTHILVFSQNKPQMHRDRFENIKTFVPCLFCNVILFACLCVFVCVCVCVCVSVGSPTRGLVLWEVQRVAAPQQSRVPEHTPRAPHEQKQKRWAIIPPIYSIATSFLCLFMPLILPCSLFLKSVVIMFSCLLFYCLHCAVPLSALLP